MVSTRIKAGASGSLKIEVVSHVLASKLKLEHFPQYFLAASQRSEAVTLIQKHLALRYTNY